MEKLQAAIDKARAQRRNTLSDRPRMADDTQKLDVLDDVWEKLPPVEIDKSIVSKNRLASIEGGAEAGPYDMLRTRILQQAAKNDWKRIAVVSPHSGCGKTTVTANLIFSFGRQTDLHTMMLDFDLRRAGLAKVLGVECKKSMADVLQGKIAFSDHAVRYGYNVAIGLSAGPVQHPSEILQNQKTGEVLDQIQATYAPDLMFFDMPPLMVTDDNFGFLKYVDCALLVAEAEQTTVKQVDMAEQQLAELTGVMGIVLNKSRYADGSYGYGYDYD
ncbi:MAG: CpsD/CapB family tyrosine-protein kinase [Rhodobacteraceae bacterium]|nr:CpsD/CapB family tyrosine-protein kinase [Paracoccaceae bacterium]